MLFNSLRYAFFLPLVFLLHWALPHKYRWFLLLVASYYFYMSWNARYALLLFFMTALSYGAACLAEPLGDAEGQGFAREGAGASSLPKAAPKAAGAKDSDGRCGCFGRVCSAIRRSEPARKAVMLSSIVLCLLLLGLFKYMAFFMETLEAVCSFLSLPIPPMPPALLLPVGISFYTFQTISYVIDVYRGSVPAERHFGIYACFIAFFPQLVAGPIERTEHLLPQIKKERAFEYAEASYGMKLMAFGFFKKLVIADTLALYVDRVFRDLPAYSSSGLSLILAIVFFSLQIYCDFSGYSDIAIGSARLLGIRLMRNFHSPYFSRSFRELWQRWHISLSTWFRDYVYIPLGGSRVSRIRRDLNLFLSFVLSGLWHGASWTYVAWGALHGIFQIAEGRIGKRGAGVKEASSLPAKRIAGNLSRALLVYVLFLFALVFFRADSFSDALYFFSHAFSGIGDPLRYLHDGFAVFGIARYRWLVLALCTALLFLYDFLSLRKDPILQLGKQRASVRYSAYIMLLLLILFFRASGETAFVYFQF